MSPTATARVVLATVLAVFLVPLWTARGSTQSATPSTAQKRVLVLQLTQPDSKFARSVDASYRRLLGSALGDRLDYYTEYLDVYRFSEPAWRRTFREFLSQRYGPIGLDLVIAPNTAQLRLVRDEEGGILTDVPIVFHAGVGVKGDDRSTGVVSRVDLAAGLKTALDLHPLTRRVVVILGSGPIDTDYANLARTQLQPFTSQVALEYLVGTPVVEMERALAQLPDHTIVYFVVYSRDVEGKHWLPLDVATRVSRVANAPVYATHEWYLDDGVVGGRLFSTERTVEATAALALRVLGGEAPAEIPVREIDPYITAFDWRQLSRWGLRDTALPPETTIMFRPMSPWSRYRVSILGTVTGAALVVGAWWVEYRRRRRAEVASGAYLNAMTDLDRRATVGHFSAVIAHELKQPLTAIGLNIDAARRKLGGGSPEPGELLEILDDLSSSNRRAAEIIEHVRELVRGHDARREESVDINALIVETLAIVSPIAQTMLTRIDFDPDASTSIVAGDRIHLQQALLNVIRNALDALHGFEPAARLITIRTVRTNSHVEVAVRDRGTGIPEDMAGQVFEPFVTSKPDGMGVGLFIVHSIAKAHSGSVSVNNHPGGGAVVRLVLPLSPAA